MFVEVSIGEAVDKYSILELKLKFINNEEKKIEIKKEIDVLNECLKYIEKYKFYYNILLFINEEIWKKTDIIKETDVSNPIFSKISYEIFELNQKRFRVKNFFNLFNNSMLKEQKSYSLNNCLIKINQKETLFSKIPEINFLSIEYDTISFDCEFIDLVKNNINIPTIDFNNKDNFKKTINLEDFLLSNDLRKKFI